MTQTITVRDNLIMIKNFNKIMVQAKIRTLPIIKMLFF